MNTHEVRRKIANILLGKNKIDKLMQDKVEDFILTEELPFAVPLGNTTIYVGNFTLDNDFKFWNGYTKLMAHLGLQMVNFDVLGNGGEMYKLITVNKKWYKGMCKLICKTILKQQRYYEDQLGIIRTENWKNCTTKYFMKNCTKEKLIEMCFGIYLFNFDAVKKNFQIITSVMKMPKEVMEQYIFFWLQNCSGLTGGFQNVHTENVISLQDDMQNPTLTEPNVKNKEGVNV